MGASQGHGFPCCRAQALGQRALAVVPPGFQSTCSVVVVLGPSSVAMWDLPSAGMEPVSPALAGRFFTTEPPGKAHDCVLVRLGCYNKIPQTG